MSSAAGVNISRDEAGDCIFGYTIFNDLSARDTQMAEMVRGLGPTKGELEIEGIGVLRNRTVIGNCCTG